MDQEEVESKAVGVMEEAEAVTQKTEATWLPTRIQGNKDEFVAECRKSSGQFCDTKQIPHGTWTL